MPGAADEIQSSQSPNHSCWEKFIMGGGATASNVTTQCGIDQDKINATVSQMCGSRLIWKMPKPEELMEIEGTTAKAYLSFLADDSAK